MVGACESYSDLPIISQPLYSHPDINCFISAGTTMLRLLYVPFHSGRPAWAQATTNCNVIARAVAARLVVYWAQAKKHSFLACVARERSSLRPHLGHGKQYFITSVDLSAQIIMNQAKGFIHKNSFTFISSTWCTARELCSLALELLPWSSCTL